MPDTGDAIATEQQSVVVLYDPNAGNIVHVYHVISDPGAHHPDRATLEKDALRRASEIASERNLSLPANPALLHVEPAGFQKNMAYKVDTIKRVLVEIRPAGKWAGRAMP